MQLILQFSHHHCKIKQGAEALHSVTLHGCVLKPKAFKSCNSPGSVFRLRKMSRRDIVVPLIFHII